MRSESIASIVENAGEMPVKARLVGWLAEIDALCGGGSDPTVFPALAQMMITEFPNRTIGTLALALRRGMATSGTVGHKLTWPRICQWMREAEEAIEEHHYNEHIRSK